MRACVSVSIASDFLETTETIIIKLGTVTASCMHASAFYVNNIDHDLHSRSQVNDLNHENNKCSIMRIKFTVNIV